MSKPVRDTLKLLLLLAGLWGFARLPPSLGANLILVGGLAAGAIYALLNLSRLFAFLSYWPGSLLYSVVVVYLCKLSAQRALNARFGIEVDYLDNAAVVYGALYSIPFSLMLLGVYLLLPQWLRRAAGRLRPGAAPAPAQKVPTFEPFFAAALVCCAGFALQQLDEGLEYALIVDAMPASNCGPVDAGTAWLRKNHNQCYRLQGNPLTGTFSLQQVDSPAP